MKVSNFPRITEIRYTADADNSLELSVIPLYQVGVAST